MNKELRILLLEDVPSDAELVLRELRKAKIKSTSKWVETKEAFIKELNEFAPDLILSDYMLPNFTGMEALRLVQELAPSTPFIIVTGSINEETAVECIKAGAWDYVTKEHLVRIGPAVEGALEKRWARKERERAQQALTLAIKHWSDTFNAIDDMIAVIDKDRRIVQANDAVYREFSDSGNIIGEHCYRLFHGTDAMIPNCPSRKVFETGEPKHGRLQEKHLGNRWFDIHAYPVMDEDNEVDQVIHVIRDVTERRRAEEEKEALQEQLLQSQKMEAIGTLSGGIAHDFNNMLTVILGNAQLALSALKHGDTGQEEFKDIIRAAERAKGLTMKLLTFARRDKLNIQPVPINSHIEELASMLKRSISKKIRLETALEKDLPNITADGNQVYQALLNIFNNACDAMPDGGTLTIESSDVMLDEEYCRGYAGFEPGHYCLVRISDTGIGMPEGIKDKVFEPFFTTKGAGRGTGLGLSTTFGIVSNHGGHVHIYSEPGKGTVVNVYLPFAEEPEVDDGGGETGCLKGGRQTILVVDDEEVVLKVAERILKKYDYNVITAGGGKEALKIYGRHGKEIALVVLDMVMPEMDGGEALSALKELDPDIKIVLSSGYSADGQVEKLMDEGVRGFIQKPFGAAELCNTVRKVLDARDPSGKF